MVPFPSQAIIRERDLNKRPILETRHLGIDFGGLTAVDDFNIDISDQIEETPLVKSFIEEAQKRSPDEMLLLQTYRLIADEHKAEALQAVLSIKMKYEK